MICFATVLEVTLFIQLVCVLGTFISCLGTMMHKVSSGNHETNLKTTETRMHVDHHSIAVCYVNIQQLEVLSFSSTYNVS